MRMHEYSIMFAVLSFFLSFFLSFLNSLLTTSSLCLQRHSSCIIQHIIRINLPACVSIDVSVRFQSTAHVTSTSYHSTKYRIRNDDTRLIMGILGIRLISKKTRRLLQVSSLTSLFIISLLLVSRWTSTSNDQDNDVESDNGVDKSLENPFLPQEVFIDAKSRPVPIISVNELDHGRPELPKYIHLDLKGAPPRATSFFPPFFKFLKKLEMGVKGVVIEYEDILPLTGRLSNVKLSTTISYLS
jgi:hypothetical protein